MKKMSTNLWVIVGLILFGAVLRASFWEGRDFWMDELVVLKISHGSLQSLLDQHRAVNSAPLFFGSLIRLYLVVLPTGNLVRLLSFIPGILSIPIGYRLGKEFYDEPTAYLLAAGIAIHSVFIQYSTELREYSWVVFECLVLLWLLRRIFRRYTSTNLVLFGMMCSLMIWTQYGLWLVVGASSLGVMWHLYQQNRRTDIVILGAMIALNMVIVYWLTLRYQMNVVKSEHLGDGYGANPLGVLGRTVWLWFFAAGGPGFIVVPLLLFTARRKIPTPIVSILLLVWLGVIVLSMFEKYPYGGLRQDIFLAIMLFSFCIIGLHPLYEHRKRLAFISGAALFIGAIGPMATNSHWVNDTDSSRLVELLQAEDSQHPILLNDFDLYVWEYYAEDTTNLMVSKKKQEPSALVQCLTENLTCWYVSFDTAQTASMIKDFRKHYTVTIALETANATALLLTLPD